VPEKLYHHLHCIPMAGLESGPRCPAQIPWTLYKTQPLIALLLRACVLASLARNVATTRSVLRRLFTSNTDISLDAYQQALSIRQAAWKTSAIIEWEIYRAAQLQRMLAEGRDRRSITCLEHPSATSRYRPSQPGIAVACTTGESLPQSPRWIRLSR
jgi:AraC-like DNA-binding protein